jgi:hypothetical protein
MKAVVHAKVVDAAPLPDEPIGVRFFEVVEDDGTQAYLIAIAPHGHAIEEHTDEEAEHVRKELVSKGILHPHGSAKDTVTNLREHLTAGTSRPPIYIQPVSRCYDALSPGSSPMRSHSMAFEDGLAKPMFTSAEEHQNI